MQGILFYFSWVSTVRTSTSANKTGIYRMTFIIEMFNGSMKRPGFAVGAVWQGFYKWETDRKAGRGHERPTMTKREKYRILRAMLLKEKNT